MDVTKQPAYIIKMRAKPGAGDKLFELATIGMAKSGASDRLSFFAKMAIQMCCGTLRSFVPTRRRVRTKTVP